MEAKRGHKGQIGVILPQEDIIALIERSDPVGIASELMRRERYLRTQVHDINRSRVYKAFEHVKQNVQTIPYIGLKPEECASIGKSPDLDLNKHERELLICMLIRQFTPDLRHIAGSPAPINKNR